MRISLLGKKLEDYPETNGYEEDIMRRVFNSELREHNIRAIRHRLDKEFEKEILESFVMSGNKFATTKEIIANIRVMKSLGILTDEEWERATPVIERGLEANKEYVRMLDEISPILERYCEEYADVNMRDTFMGHVHLECWQGRFSDHHANPDKKPNYF